MPELRLDPYSRVALLGLLRRALAGNAEAGRSAIGRRRIEQLQAQRTELMKQRSVLVTDEQTAQSRMKDAVRSARDARLDVQIFTEEQPEPPAAHRGLFGTRPSPERRAWEAERRRLDELATLEEAEAAEYAAIHEQIAARLQGLSEDFDRLNDSYAAELAMLREQLAAWVFLQLSGGAGADAREELGEFRRLLRGELSVAVLLSLLQLFDEGPQAALTGLGELTTIWEQHPDPLRQVLEGAYRLLRDGRLERREAGMFSVEQFSQPGHWRLYRLLRVLGGWPDPAERDAAGIGHTLWALEHALLSQAPPADWQGQPSEGLAAWSSGEDCVVQLLCCLTLWQRGDLSLIPQAAGIPLAEIRAPQRRGEDWPGLYATLSGRMLPAWPQPLAGLIWSELACLVLLAAQRTAPDELYRFWLQESGNWPKTRLYWWTRSRLQEDPALMQRCRDEQPGLIAVEPGSL
ncbi:MAG: hypothetical protein R3F46_00030 [bacterium]